MEREDDDEEDDEAGATSSRSACSRLPQRSDPGRARGRHRRDRRRHHRVDRLGARADDEADARGRCRARRAGRRDGRQPPRRGSEEELDERRRTIERRSGASHRGALGRPAGRHRPPPSGHLGRGRSSRRSEAGARGRWLSEEHAIATARRRHRRQRRAAAQVDEAAASGDRTAARRSRRRAYRRPTTSPIRLGCADVMRGRLVADAVRITRCWPEPDVRSLAALTLAARFCDSRSRYPDLEPRTTCRPIVRHRSPDRPEPSSRPHTTPPPPSPRSTSAWQTAGRSTRGRGALDAARRRSRAVRRSSCRRRT